jgi:hypothetical protein
MSAKLSLWFFLPLFGEAPLIFAKARSEWAVVMNEIRGPDRSVIVEA